MLIATLVTLAQIAAPAPTQLLQLDGRCEYTPAVQEAAEGGTLWLCNRATVLHDSVEASFRFDLPSSGSVTFVGSLEGDKMLVSHLSFEPGTTRDARGSCKIDRANGRISVIACTAMVGARFHAVNFIPTRAGY